jgi:uncharacterized protein YbbC (DUF1343 family)
MPIDLLIGDPGVRQALESGTEIDILEASWQEGLKEFRRIREAFFLY